MQELSEARHDEERVVDPDADADHRHEDRRDRVDVGQPGEDEEEEERRSDGHECQRDRDRGGDERAEDDQEHDERGQEAEQLLDSLLDGRELGIAVELDADAGRASTVSRTASSTATTCGRSSVSIVSENCASAYAMRPSSENVSSENGSPTLSTPALPSWGLNSGVLSLAIACLDRGLALGRVEPLPRRRREDEVQDGALLGGELRLDQVDGLLRIRARDLEHVLEGSPRRWPRGRSGSQSPRASRESRATGAWRTCAPSVRALPVERRSWAKRRPACWSDPAFPSVIDPSRDLRICPEDPASAQNSSPTLDKSTRPPPGNFPPISALSASRGEVSNRICLVRATTG